MVSKRGSRAVARGMLVLAAALAGCAALAPASAPLGTPIAEVRRGSFGPTGEYPLPGGGTRLEFAQGSFGKQTWMMDFDAQGKLVSKEQVLTEANFARIVPGMPGSEVLMRLGRPAHVFSVPRQKIQVWNYRFFGGDCVWFQVSVSNAGPVTEAGIGMDPACDGPNNARE
ncbi:MAG: hypothetical protein ABI671_06530 [Burkholderiales bacterium]